MASKGTTELNSLYAGDFYGEGDDFQQDYHEFNEEDFSLYIRNSQEDYEYLNETLNELDWYNSTEPLTDESLFDRRETITQKQAIQELVDNTNFNKKEATELIKQLKKDGYELLNSETQDGEYYFNLRLGNQLLQLSASSLNVMTSEAEHTLFGDITHVSPSEFCHYFAKELPDIYKFYPGKIEYYGNSRFEEEGTVEGGYYHPLGNSVHLGPESTRSWEYKRVLEHELTHRLDNYGGRSRTDSDLMFAPSLTHISDHPMFKIASEVFTASNYSNSYYGSDPHPYFKSKYRQENFAESTAPLGTQSYVDTPLNSKVQWTPYTDYQKYNSYGDYIGRNVREAKTPKQVIEFLNKEYIQYRERNPEIFEKYETE